MECRMQDFRDDNGQVPAIAPDTIIIPNDWKLKKDLFAALGADKDPNTSNNGFNYTFGRFHIVTWQYLNQFINGRTSRGSCWTATITRNAAERYGLTASNWR